MRQGWEVKHLQEIPGEVEDPEVGEVEVEVSSQDPLDSVLREVEGGEMLEPVQIQEVELAQMVVLEVELQEFREKGVLDVVDGGDLVVLEMEIGEFWEVDVGEVEAL